MAVLRYLVSTTGPGVHIWSDLAPKEAFGNIWKHFWLLQLGQGCYWWVKVRNAAQHPTVDPAPCVNGAEYTMAQWSVLVGPGMLAVPTLVSGSRDKEARGVSKKEVEPSFLVFLLLLGPPLQLLLLDCLFLL